MLSRVPLRFLLLLTLALGACTPKIGDECVLSTDCSLQGNRQCDTSQPSGYCTIFDCSPNSCPDNAACVLFQPAVPGCSYSDRGLGRTARSYCMAGCQSDGDCRAGYLCVDPRKAPWDAVILDDNQSQTICIFPDDTAVWAAGTSSDGAAPVCQADPDIDAALPPMPDAGAPTADAGAPSDAGTDATLTDSGSASDAGDAGLKDGGGADAGSDAGGPDGGPGDAASD